MLRWSEGSEAPVAGGYVQFGRIDIGMTTLWALLIGVLGMTAVGLAIVPTPAIQKTPTALALAPESARLDDAPAPLATTEADASLPALPVPSGAALRMRPLAQRIVIAGAEPPRPSLKPRRRAPGIPVEIALNPGARYLAPSTRIAFASPEDFGGGRQNFFEDYAEARRRDRTEKAYLTLVLSRGEEMATSLVNAGADKADVTALIAAVRSVAAVDDLRRVTAVDYALETIPVDPAPGAVAGAAAYRPALVRLRFQPDSRHVVTAWRESDGTYSARIEEIAVERRYAAVAGVIRDSLFASAARTDVPPEVMVRFANLFLYDVDFARDLHVGDRFEVVYEVFHDTQGGYVGAGEVLFAGMTWNGGRDSRGYYRYTGVPDIDIPYFDANGESATRLLMKTPIDGARVTSGFGMRKHPILGYSKEHTGVDFGAPSGTPIMAAGDGKVIKAEVFGAYGNYVRIEHAHGYSTAYAHLSAFKKGLKKGAKIRQGDIIGYVGSTGRSTGPHLHYEVHHRGSAQNPMTLEVANGRVLDETFKAPFEGHRAFLDGVRVHPLTIAAATDQ